jgi:hypothetical protein
MKRLFRRLALVLVLAWMPLNALAAAGLPSCLGHGSMPVPASDHGVHHHDAGASQHHGEPDGTPAAPEAAACGLCGLCHQFGQVLALSGFDPVRLDPPSWQPRLTDSFSSRFVPDPLRRPPRG